MLKLSRRTLLSGLAGGSLAASRIAWAGAPQRPADAASGKSMEEFVGAMVWTEEIIDEYLDPEEPSWGVFDPELGYRHGDTVKKDGIDGSYCIYRMEPTSERKKIHFAHRPCRINTYGDSFTHCDQVNDGETWQEYLAAHFGETIRNFGVGGYGIYQAYRRMLREEATDSSAPFVLFNIWIDDHRRSLMKSRWFHLGRFREHLVSRRATHYFHANPWCHVRLDPANGALVEHENDHRTAESLYAMCEPDYIVELLRDDLYMQIQFAMEGGTPAKLAEIEQLANLLGMEADWSSQEAISKSAERLFWLSGMKASEHIVHKALAFAKSKQKRLLVILSDRGSNVENACRGGSRLDQPFVDFLRRSNIQYLDLMEKHVADYKQFNIEPAKYVRRYYKGHYNPAGNHFFAFGVKDELVDWLDPRPFTYNESKPSISEVSAMLAK